MCADVMYGGEDMSALVFDVGHHSLRIGYAQETTPKADIPAVVGVCDELESMACFGDADWEKAGKNVNENGTIGKKFFVDTNYLHVAKEGMEVLQYMKDGMINDWNLFEKMLDYVYGKVLHCESNFHPVLMTEAAWNEPDKREKITELMFEKYNVPAFFLVKNSVLAAFAHARTTAIVVDSGATHTSVVPVEDGFVLKKAIVRTPLGGDFLTAQCEELLKMKAIQVVPSYMVGAKECVKEKERSRWTPKKNLPNVTASWHEYMKYKTLQDFQISVLQVSEAPFDEMAAPFVPPAHYEFPDGYHQDFGAERLRVAEALFAPGAGALGLAEAVTTSGRLCDVDSRQALYGNAVITGGNSLLQGFSERLCSAVQRRLPGSARFKAAGGRHGGGGAACAGERRFAAWLGGSLLAALGSFGQMWVSRKEYGDGGAAQIARKCP